MSVSLRTWSVVLLCTACSGSTPQDVIGSASGASSSSSGGGGSSGSSSTSSSGSVQPPGDSGGGNDGGNGACPREEESNDEPSSANTLVTSICGDLSPPTEVDYLTFVLPQGTTSMSLTFEGNIRMRVSVEGHGTTEISPASSPPIPIVAGRPYLVEVRLYERNAGRSSYRVNLIRS